MEVKQVRIKVFLITGFLGAGKTTVLNHLLEAKKQEQNVIIENEFGKISIDSLLVTDRYDSIFELNNGCICCSLDNELALVLAKLVCLDPRPDNLFIEASGVADPGGVTSLFSQEEVSRYFDLQQVICLADASSIEDVLEDIPEASRQIAAADLIFLNKKSLISPVYCSALVSLIQAINSLAEICLVDHGKFSLDILNRKRQDWKQVGPDVSRVEKGGHPFKSLLFEFIEPFDFDLLLNQVTVLLFLSYHQVYRIKGLVWFKGEAEPHMVQTHGRQLDVQPYKRGRVGIYPKSQLVVIGKGLQRASLEKFFNRSLYKKHAQVSNSILDL